MYNSQADINATRMRIAIEGVELTYQPIFSLIAELSLQTFPADAAALQAILDSLKLLVSTIKDDVAL